MSTVAESTTQDDSTKLPEYMNVIQSENAPVKAERTKRRIKFAEDLEHHRLPKSYWDDAETVSKEYLEAAYFASCQLNNTTPNSIIIQQFREYSNLPFEKQQWFRLKGEKLDLPQVEALETIFKRVQLININIEKCQLTEDAASALFDMFLHYESAENVQCGFNRNMGHRGWISIAQFIKRSNRVDTFDCPNAIIPDTALAPLSRALRSSNCLRCLHLESCSLSGRPIALLAAGLRSNQSLQELYLSENRLSPTDATHLRALITLSQALTLLDVRNNNIQDIGLLHLCEALKNPTCVLTTLILWNNQISSSSIGALTEALMKNTKLHTLNLGQNAIQDNGACTLKMGLQANSSLVRLGLVGCRLSDPGIVAIAEFLAESSRIERLDMRNNDIGLGGLMALSLAARENTSAFRIDLDKPVKDNNLPQELLDRQTQLWDDFAIYAARNRRVAKETLTLSALTSPSAMSDCNDNIESKKREIEFHYIDVEPPITESKAIPTVLTPNSAEKEIEVSSSLPTFDSLSNEDEGSGGGDGEGGDVECDSKC